MQNFETMHHHVYSAMVDSKVAIQLEEEVWVKLDGTITQHEEESTGRKMKYLLTHPELIFFSLMKLDPIHHNGVMAMLVDRNT